mmetsp:Transcript_7848/g.9795  ORF Transcript_7848/g.9795 Transcript_7848/m.9795 type:complete len:270 (+) Transcript_7848:62-871(+)
MKSVQTGRNDDPLSTKDTPLEDGSKEQERQEELTQQMETKKRKKVHKLSLEETEDFNAKLKRRGVIYIGRIPPRMGPTKAKALLGEFGVVTRIYLEEEDKSARKRRQRATGSHGGKRYTEGWVEFEDKKVAKRVAVALNNTPITNHKRSVHYGDLWSMKYLNKFQWSHLTEKVAYERRVREQRLKIEMMQARKENQAYSKLVEAGKTMDRIESRRRRREERESNDDGHNTKKNKIAESAKKPTRKFRQNKPVSDRNDKAAKAAILNSLV